MQNESAVRRKARRRLSSLMKFRANSRWFTQYGPYALVDEQNVIAHSGLDLEEASSLLDAVPVASER